MSLSAKKAKWRRSLKLRGARLISRLNAAWRSSSMAELSTIATQELSTVAAHYYRLGREAGIAEGRRRAACPTN